MTIAERLRAIREQKQLSQRDIATRAGWVGPYVSRVECGHVIPTVENLEKFARALKVPLWQLFYGLDTYPSTINSHVEAHSRHRRSWRQERIQLQKFAAALSEMNDSQRDLFMAIATKIAKWRA
jgi:transcriptional regulator with XRE-family HTH domain